MNMVVDKARKAPAWQTHWPLWAAGALFLVLLGLTLAAQLSFGRILLPEEDAYQRLAVAKNLAERFAWEIIPGQFTSAFGTVLWPVLIAPVFLLLGANAIWPWIINAVLALALVALAYRAVRGTVSNRAAQALLLVVLVIGLPLVPLAAGGMEQVLYLVFMILFLERWARRMEDPAKSGLLPLALVSFLLASTRYEGLLLVAMAALFLLLKRDFTAGFLMPVVAALPLAVFGYFSWRAGWLPVPASVYLRRAELIPSDPSQIPSVVFRSLDVLGANPELRSVVLLLTLLPAWAGFAGRIHSVRERDFFAPALALAAVLVDLTLIGDRGYRYDAWLVLLGGWAFLPALGKILPTDFRDLRRQAVTLFAGGALTLLLGFPLVNRGVQAAVAFGGSVENARRLAQSAAQWTSDCAAGPVATDAPGTIVFLTGREDVVDLSGFVNLEAFRVRRGGAVSAEWMRAEAERTGASTAVLFQPLLQAQAGAVWARIGGWSRADCTGCGGVEIFLIAADASTARCTDDFLSRLPPMDVVREGDRGGAQ
jgi:hypothetical protein